MKAMRLPSGDQAASVTVVEKSMVLSPTTTCLLPLESRSMPCVTVRAVSDVPVLVGPAPLPLGVAQAAASTARDAAVAASSAVRRRFVELYIDHPMVASTVDCPIGTVAVRSG